MPHYLGIEIGGTKLQLPRADQDLTIIKRFRFKVDQLAGAEGMCAIIENSISQINEDITSIGVGFGGPDLF